MSPWIYVVGGAVLLLWLYRRLARRTEPTDAWRALGEAEGLRFESSGVGPSLRGRYRDTEVRLSTERPRGAGPTEEPATVIQAEIPLPGTTGVWGAASHRLVDGQDPWTRPGRDGLALVRQHNSEAVVKALHRSPVRDAVRAFLSARPGARIAEDWVTLTEPGLVRDRRRLQRLLDEVVAVSRQFRDPAAESTAPVGAGIGPVVAGGDREPEPTGGWGDEERGGARERDPWGDAEPGAEAGAPRDAGTDAAADPDPDPANPYAPPRPPGAPPRERSVPRRAADPRVAARWRRRLAVAFVAGLLPATLGATMAIVGGIRYDAQVFGLQGLWWLLLGGGLFGLGLLVFGAQYRCPSCGQVMRSPSSGNLLFDPDECPHCHVVLRD